MSSLTVMDNSGAEPLLVVDEGGVIFDKGTIVFNGSAYFHRDVSFSNCTLSGKGAEEFIFEHIAKLEALVKHYEFILE